jgi:hypothetical protein
VFKLFFDSSYLARWCESAGLDSSPLIEYAHNAWDTYYGFRPTLPHIPDALWVLLERLKYRLHPFQLRPFAEQTSATDEEHRKPIPPDEANIGSWAEIGNNLDSQERSQEVRRRLPDVVCPFAHGNILLKIPFIDTPERPQEVAHPRP